MKKKDKNTFATWWSTKHSVKCKKYFSGLLGAMESEGAVRMCCRSEGQGL